MCLFQEIFKFCNVQYSPRPLTQHYATDPLNLGLTFGETTEWASYEAQDPEVDGLISSSNSDPFSIVASSPSPVPRNSICLPLNVADDPGTISPATGRFVPLSPVSREAYFKFKLFTFPAPADGQWGEDHASGTIGTGAHQNDNTTSYTKGFHKAHTSDFSDPFLYDDFESQMASQVDVEVTPISSTGRLLVWSGPTQKRKKLAKPWIISSSDDEQDSDPIQDSPSLSRTLNSRAIHYG